MKNISFTGHRMIAKKHISHVLHQLQIILTLAVEAGYTDFYAGGAIGWDTYCVRKWY